jgi:hypothetical protein
MELKKYKITSASAPGYMMVTYHDSHLKSILNEFKPPLTDVQLNYILNRIPDDQAQLSTIIEGTSKGKLSVESVKSIGEEPAATVEDIPVNEKIAIFCELYEQAEGIKYKVTAAEIGKIKALAITAEDLRFVLESYFPCQEWFAKIKSVGNFVRYFNELRAIAYARPRRKGFKLPYNHEYYVSLSMMDKRDYHIFLKENGYEYQPSGGRGGNWTLKSNLTK